MLKKKKLAELSMNLTVNRVDFMSAFRSNMYMYLNNKGITLMELSEVSQIPCATLRTMLYSNSRDVNLSNAIKLARALNISIDELVGAETIPEITRESLKLCRNLPDNDLYLIRWFIRYLNKLNSKNKPNKRYVSVMELECNGNGNLKITTQYRKEDITEINDEIKGKVFFGITMPCDHYMPTYSPYDILLIANDRFPTLSENCLIRINGILHIAKRKSESGIVKYYSIRDKKYRVDETDIDELIGYVAGKITKSSL